MCTISDYLLVQGFYRLTSRKGSNTRTLYFFRYNSTTGMFTVPPGGDGMYFFYIFMKVDWGEYALFEIRINNVRMCSANGDHDTLASDNPSATCGVVASLTAGNHTITI